MTERRPGFQPPNSCIRDHRRGVPSTPDRCQSGNSGESKCSELLDRPDAPLKASVDFEIDSGQTRVALSLGDEQFSPPSGEVGPVVKHGGKWCRVTPSQRDLMERLSRFPPMAGQTGQYQIEAAASPDLIPYLRSRSDVEVSERARAVRVSHTAPTPAVEMEEAPDESLIVKPAFRPPESEQLLGVKDFQPAGEKWTRHGSDFFPKPSVNDPVFQALAGSTGGTNSVPAGTVPDFLVGPPSGTGPDVEGNGTGHL